MLMRFAKKHGTPAQLALRAFIQPPAFSCAAVISGALAAGERRPQSLCSFFDR